MKKTVFIITAMILVCAGVFAQEQYWQVVSADHIKQMSTFERAQYLKGLNLINKKQYRAAALEFERYTLQYQTSDMKPYMIFLRAFSLYMAKDRNKAISVFNEVVDYFPGEINAAAPAIYYRGMASFDNGDYQRGMTSMKELVDDEDYKEHRVAASASLQLVRNYWRNKEPEKAAEYLKKIFDDFRDKAPETAEVARNYFIGYCFCTNHVSDFQSWYFENYAAEAVEKKLSKEQFRINMVTLAYDQIIMKWHWIYNVNELMSKYRGGKKNGSDPLKELWTLMNEMRPSFEKENDLWNWYHRSIRLAARRSFLTKDQFEALVMEACKFIASVSDGENKNRQQNRYNEMIARLFEGSSLDLVLHVNAYLKDSKARAWNEYEVLRRRGKYQEAAAQLNKMISNFKDDVEYVKRANWQKGWLLRDLLGKYDEAIAVYKEIGEPPRTLWEITECHKRKKDKNSVIRQLVEIENAFPDHGGAAAWARAEYYHSIGEKTMAIKEGRYIMKKYPKSKQSSSAHQLLEKYGIETGGGVVDDM